MKKLISHLRHHARFYSAALFGLAVYAGLACFAGATPFHATIAGDCFFGAYIIGIGLLLRDSTPAHIRARARIEDESTIYVFILMILAAILGLWTSFMVLHQKDPSIALRIVLGISTVALAWFAVHMAAAVHYAHMFYGYDRQKNRDPRVAANGPDAQGLIFPQTETPLFWDFLYFSFVIGMTAQVSDVQITHGALRRFALLHGVASFFFNTIILALAVNIAASLST